MPRVVIVHGWGATPESDWFPWLKTELEKRGYAVSAPAMPDTDHPEIAAWVNRLRAILGTPSEETILVGHSIGCQTIMRYLEQVNVNVSRIVLVAPWLTLTGLSEEEMPIAKPWLETPIDFEKVQRSAKEIVAFFSDDDAVVPLKNEAALKSKLRAKTIIEHGMGHFSGDDGVTEVPSVLEEIVRNGV